MTPPRDEVDARKELAEHEAETQREMQDHEVANRLASREAEKQVTENREMVDVLRDPDIPDELHNELGPAASGAHVTARRPEGWVEHQRWHNTAKSDRLKVEHRPGRLVTKVTGPTGEPGMIYRVMRGVYDSADGAVAEHPPDRLSSKQERHVTDSMEALTSQQSGGEMGTVLKRLTEIIAVSKTETDEEESQSVLERTAGLFQG